jgi:hypothetical protein
VDGGLEVDCCVSPGLAKKKAGGVSVLQRWLAGVLKEKVVRHGGAEGGVGRRFWWWCEEDGTMGWPDEPDEEKDDGVLVVRGGSRRQGER